jgi:hypothetical protein
MVAEGMFVLPPADRGSFPLVIYQISPKWRQDIIVKKLELEESR